jgi:ABC-type uncharacterized transport system involved in gliding motility auxiliary subunit
VAKTMLTTTGLLAGAAAFLAVNLLAERTLSGARVDLTDNGLYTVSAGTRSVLRQLEEPVALKLYYSQATGTDIPTIRSYEQRVRGLLDEFVAGSGGKLRLEVKNPEPFSETEDEAQAAGIQPMSLDQTGDSVLYFGLVATGSTDDHEVISFLYPNREDSLEYDVTRIIHKLGHTKRPTLAIVTALPLAGHPAMPWAGQSQGQDPYYVYQELQDVFEVSVVPPGATELPKNLDVLMVAHPKAISDELTYAIDQYILHGGHALVMVDPFCESDAPPDDPQDPMARFSAQRGSSLTRLFDAWGIEMPADGFAGDRATAPEVPSGPRRQPIVDLRYQQLGKDQFNADDVVTSSLTSMVVSTPGILKKKDGATIEMTPLLHTSPESAQIPTSDVQFAPDAQRMLAEFVPGNAPLTMAARLHGTARTAFPEGRPAPPKPPEPDKAGTPPVAVPDPDFLAESKQPINVIVVADADLLYDGYWVVKHSLLGQTLVEPRAGNGDFVLAALDNLAGSDELISIRSRKSFDRPFKVMEDLKRDADQRFAAKEQALEEQLRDTEKKLNDLESKKGENAGSLILSPEQQAEIDRFQAEKLATRKELRDVRFELNQDIERVQTWIKVVDIGLVPALLCVLALGLWSWRRQRRA